MYKLSEMSRGHFGIGKGIGEFSVAWRAALLVCKDVLTQGRLLSIQCREPVCRTYMASELAAVVQL